MNIHQRISRFCEQPWSFWVVLFPASLLFFWYLKQPIKRANYEFNRTETVEVVSVRPHKNSNGGQWFLISFRFDDGDVDYMSLSNIDTLQAGGMIRVDVIAHPHKNNRYRLAQDPIAP